MGDFSDRVFEVVRRIPRGKVATYGQVGRLIGAPRSARYVGYALRANPEPGAEVNSIPCHRVVFKDGGLWQGVRLRRPRGSARDAGSGRGRVRRRCARGHGRLPVGRPHGRRRRPYAAHGAARGLRLGTGAGA